ncbi:hypothetical protein K4F52_002455 [Lecanicillium sp. MT-2017a]|nr:hypothetical protein K4F52_002455 [Lecanicillium sp. MT-2017a]
MASAPSVDLPAWFNQHSETAFGHCKRTTDRMVYRVHNALLALEKLAGEGKYTFYYAVPGFETAQLLLWELSDIDRTANSEQTSQRSIIINYNALIEILRNQTDIQSQDCVTFVIEFDYEFSAEFALSLIELTFYAREPRGTKLRVLTTSIYDDVDVSLVRLQSLVCPNIARAVVVQLDNDHRAAYLPQLVPAHTEDGNSFIVEAARLIQAASANGQCSIVMCHSEEEDKIRPLLDSVPSMNLGRTSAEHIGGYIKSLLEVEVNTGMAIFLPKATRFPIKVPRLKAVIVSSFCNATIWQGGRLVKVAQNVSQHEIRELLDSAIETTTPAQEVEILVPADDTFRRHFPRRRVDGEQIWGLIVEGISNYRAVDCTALLGCFVTNPIVLNAAFKQLCVMGCIQVDRRSTDGNAYRLNATHKGRRLLQLLPAMEYKIFPAWFLAVGLALHGVTPAATRAMIRIAAMEFLPGRILSQFELNMFTPDAELQLARLCEGIAEYVSMPRRMLLQGNVWMCLAIYEASFRISNGFTNDVASVNVSETPAVSVAAAAARVIAAHVEWLECLLGAQQADAQVLSLSSDDCRLIQQAMTDAWMYRILHIRSTMLGRQLHITVEDPTTEHGGGLDISTLDMWPVNQALGPYENEKRAVIVSAEINRVLAPVGDTVASFFHTAVLPFTCIANWQDRNPGLKYLNVVREFR